MGTGALARRGAVVVVVAACSVAAFAPVELDDEAVDFAQVFPADVEDDFAALGVAVWAVFIDGDLGFWADDDAVDA